MRIEYIGHSGVLVQLENTNLLFDVIAFPQVASDPDRSLRHDIGRFPQLDTSQNTAVFASHFHGDHYTEQIWGLRDSIPEIMYVISKDIPFSSGVRRRLAIDDSDMENITRVKGYSSQDISFADGETIHVQTIPSTDEGVAFLVKAEGKIIYHAGDHHLWVWEGNTEQHNDDMRQVFRRTLSRLELGDTEKIDVAFLLLDGRLEGTAYEGMNTYIEMLPIRHVIPIHQWKNYSLTDSYLADISLPDGVVMHKVTGENCSFEP